jgi:hypothetical protein
LPAGHVVAVEFIRCACMVVGVSACVTTSCDPWPPALLARLPASRPPPRMHPRCKPTHRLAHAAPRTTYP